MKPRRRTITLRFKDHEQLDYFMGQLSDGWGENRCGMKWTGDLSNVRVVDVDPTVDTELWDHHERMKALWPELGEPNKETT